MKKKSAFRWNLFDLFLALLIVLAVFAIYFTFVSPIKFSHMIKREGVPHYAEVEFLLPDDLYWMKEALPGDEEYRNVYGEIDWKILEKGEVTLGGRKIAKIKAKILIVEESSGILRYGKYTLVKGSKIFLINDHYFLEGRILNFQISNETVKYA